MQLFILCTRIQIYIFAIRRLRVNTLLSLSLSQNNYIHYIHFICIYTSLTPTSLSFAYKLNLNIVHLITHHLHESFQITILYLYYSYLRQRTIIFTLWSSIAFRARLFLQSTFCLKHVHFFFFTFVSASTWTSNKIYINLYFNSFQHTHLFIGTN